MAKSEIFLSESVYLHLLSVNWRYELASAMRHTYDSRTSHAHNKLIVNVYQWMSSVPLSIYMKSACSLHQRSLTYYSNAAETLARLSNWSSSEMLVQNDVMRQQSDEVYRATTEPKSEIIFHRQKCRGEMGRFGLSLDQFHGVLLFSIAVEMAKIGDMASTERIFRGSAISGQHGQFNELQSYENLSITSLTSPISRSRCSI